MSTVFSVSWIYEEFRAVRMQSGKPSASWESPEPVHTLEELASAFRQACEALDMHGGGTVAIAYESDVHHHQFLELPHMPRKDTARYMMRQVEKTEQEDDVKKAWGYRCTPHGDIGVAALLHVMPKSTLDGIIRICEENFLVPSHLVPLDDIMSQHVAETEGTPGSKLVIALFDSRVEMVVMLETGEALLVRELSFNWRDDDLQRLVTDIERTLLYAKQRHGGTPGRVKFIGHECKAAAEAIGSRVSVPVEAVDSSDDRLFWASYVADLPRDLTSNFIPPYMRRTFSRRRLMRIGVWTAAAALVVALGSTTIFQAFFPRYVADLKRTQQSIASLRAERDAWEARYEQLADSKARLERLSERPPPVPLWVMSFLSESLPEQLMLSRAAMEADGKGWRLELNGAANPPLGDAARAIAELEDRLRQPPLNAYVDPGWRNHWLRQFDDGKAAQNGKVGFAMNGAVQ